MPEDVGDGLSSLVAGLRARGMQGKLRQAFATFSSLMASYFTFLFVRGNGIHVLSRFGNTDRIVYTLQLTVYIYIDII